MGLPIRTLIRALVGRSRNSATYWDFAANGLAGTPWASKTRTGDGSFITEAGLIALTSQPRITHDPVTLARLGLLIEGQASQLLRQTDNLAGSEWGRSNVKLPVAGAGYLGRNTWVVENDTGGLAVMVIGVALAASGPCVTKISIFAGTSASMSFGLYDDATAFGTLTGQIESGPGALSGGSGAPITVSALSSTVPTVIIVRATLAPGGATGLYFYPASGSGDSTRVQVDNVETGSYPTSYIPNPTTGSMVRAADDWFLGVDDLSAAFPAGTGVGTVVLRVSKTIAPAATPESVIALTAGGYSAGNILCYDYEGAWNIDNAVVGHSFGPVLYGAENKIAISWDAAAGSFSASANGGASVQTTGAALNTFTRLALGHTGVGALPAKKLIVAAARVLPGQYITGAALQALSA